LGHRADAALQRVKLIISCQYDALGTPRPFEYKGKEGEGEF